MKTSVTDGLSTDDPATSWLVINGSRVAGEGRAFERRNPADETVVWQGTSASTSQTRSAVEAAAAASSAWRLLPPAQRAAHLQAFADILRSDGESLARIITTETGKPLWESRAEVTTCVAKVDLTLRADRDRRTVPATTIGAAKAEVLFRPLGVVIVLGPFNFPAHLPGGQIVPALLAGNTVVFKPSELTPGTGYWLVDAWLRAGLPPGVLNLIQGGADVATAAIDHDAVSGVMFTGSHRAGKAIHERLAGRTQVLLALEMGGNNPLVLLPPYDDPVLPGATIASAYITAGQRCTCARRLILLDTQEANSFLQSLVDRISRVRLGLPGDEPEPYLGPVVSAVAADQLLAAQQQWIDAGGVPLATMKRSTRSRALLSPGLIDMTDVRGPVGDDEHFGPLLQVYRVTDWDRAIAKANDTRFGLAASLMGGTAEQFEHFRRSVAAGVINWNRQTTGASGALPFGGLGASGNHRPAGFWATDACSDPVASLLAESVQDDGFDRSQL